MGSVLRRRRLLGSKIPGVVYWVHSVLGNDSNAGTNKTLPKLTIASALTALGSTRGTIKVYAPQATPQGTGMSTAYTIASGQNVTIEGWDGQAWYNRNSAQFTSGWTQVGSTNVWTRTNNAGSDAWWVNIADTAWGNYNTPIIQNNAAGSSPGSFEYSIVSTTTYINLGGLNPNSYVIDRPRIANHFLVQAGGTLTLKNARMYYSSTGTIIDNAGILYARDCEVWYSNGSGWGTSTGATYTELISCKAYRSRTNDGFNHNVGTMVLYGCEAWYNRDEGGSPHSTSTLFVYGGIYAYNGSPAFTAANSSRMELYGVICHHNLHTPSVSETDFGQIHYGSSASGRCENCSTTFSGAKGFWSQGSGIIVVGLISSNNAAADIITP